MAEKISMLLVKVDLDCHKCYNKMRKILCKLQDQEGIRMISFDDKTKTIALAGPFDAQRLACRIRCRGGKTVKDVQIVDVPGGGSSNGKPPPPRMVEMPPPSHGKKPKKEKPPAAAEQPPQPSSPPPEPAQEPPPEMPHSPPPGPATPDRGVAPTPMPPFHEEDKPMPRPAELEPPPPPSPKAHPPPMEYYMPPPPPAMKPRPVMPPPRPAEPFPAEYVIPPAEIPSWPAAPVGPCGCPCCAPCYQGYYEGCRCGCGGARLLPPGSSWCAYPRGCRIINEEDPNAACAIM